MQRDATVPIGVWLPAVIASVVVAVCWSTSARAPRNPPQVDRNVAAPAAAPDPKPAAVPPPDAVVLEPDAPAKPPPDVAPLPEPPAPVVTAPESAAPDAVVPEIETRETREAREAREARDPPPAEVQRPPPPATAAFPAGWQPLEAVPADAFGDAPIAASAKQAVEAARARMHREAATCRTSAAALAPFVVFVASDDEGARLARLLAGFHERFTARVLKPARLTEPLAVALPIDRSARSDAEPRADPKDALLLRDFGEQWLAALFDARGGARPPRWWCDGAIEVARHEKLSKALAAAPAGASLTALFDERDRDGARAAASTEAQFAAAGSFAAYCLGAAGRDDHCRSTWLEFAAPLQPLASNGRSGKREGGDAWRAELAARFGFATLSELEQAWHAARGE